MSSRGGLRSARVLALSTSVRIVLAPVVMGLLLADDKTPGTAADVAAALFCVAGVTDWVGGRLARGWGVASSLGAVLDTTAGKLLGTGGPVALGAGGGGPTWS